MPRRLSHEDRQQKSFSRLFLTSLIIDDRFVLCHVTIIHRALLDGHCVGRHVHVMMTSSAGEG